MADAIHVSGVTKTFGDERRRYYRVTELGRAVASAEARRMKSLVEAAASRGLLEQAAP